MNCTVCGGPIHKGQPYARTKRGSHHFKDNQCIKVPREHIFTQSELDAAVAQARLEEIKVFDCDSLFTSENKRKRIAELEAAAGRK